MSSIADSVGPTMWRGTDDQSENPDDFDRAVAAQQDAPARFVAASKVKTPTRTAPADVNDDAAWADYLRATTPEPTDEDRIATLIAVASPYAEARARCVEGFRRIARALWRDRRKHGRDDAVTENHRAVMANYADAIRRYDRLARAWAHKQLVEQADQIERVTIR